MHTYLTPYIDLIDSFVQAKISAPEFEIQYLNLFKTLNTHFEDEREYEILNDLFSSADSYCSDPTLRDSEWDIDEHQLLADAKKALSSLKSLDRAV